MTKATRKTLLVVLAGLSLVSAALAADRAYIHKADQADETKVGRAIFVSPRDLEWVYEAEGVQTATVEGDPKTGPSHFFTQLDGGHMASLHYHTADHFGTVVSGTLVLIVDGKEHALPAGSFFGLTGRKQHETRCEYGAPCVFSTEARGRWDKVPVDDSGQEK